MNANPEIYANLRSVGCCKRCCLRYLGERSPEAYRNVDDWLVKNGLEEAFCGDNKETKTIKANPCIVCLGLLQDLTSSDTIQKISSHVLSTPYDCDTFTCAISLPVAFQLRAHSLWFHLLNKFPAFFTTLDLHQENYVTTIKDVWKWISCPLISKLICKEHDSGVACDFFVEISVTYSDDEEECSCLLKMHEKMFNVRKTQKRKYGSLYTRKAVELALQGTESEHFKKYFPSPAHIPTKFVTYGEVTCSHNSIYFAGCYNKFSRCLSQTPWVIEGERRMESSVQEIICESLQLASKADGTKFVTSGREDVDVRMLGNGRPFACELLNPHTVKFSLEEIQALEVGINSCTKDVAVRNLQIITKDDLHHLKDGEESKHKRYSALCICQDDLSPSALEKLDSTSDLTLCQKTPIRVLHRRPLAVRNRTVYSMKATILEKDTKGKLFKLDITTQAGTYIKEFIHGDFGRTKPSLGQLLGGVSVDILALDVEEIYLDWPPLRSTSSNLKNNHCENVPQPSQ